ncbi:hypothetical protein L1987_42513 [Smallanthus sonchifolius]|uniref:Uncharacterized protein n=1 Tax=Smallanthus sonchifolius TaxID=185202 RepID=A0ACB9GKA7_9ASTR|nr:hypothetical protein L1987_42513 [Smallanthus sonchifolius]
MLVRVDRVSGSVMFWYGEIRGVILLMDVDFWRLSFRAMKREPSVALFSAFYEITLKGNWHSFKKRQDLMLELPRPGAGDADVGGSQAGTGISKPSPMAAMAVDPVEKATEMPQMTLLDRLEGHISGEIHEDVVSPDHGGVKIVSGESKGGKEVQAETVVDPSVHMGKGKELIDPKLGSALSAPLLNVAHSHPSRWGFYMYSFDLPGMGYDGATCGHVSLSMSEERLATIRALREEVKNWKEHNTANVVLFKEMAVSHSKLQEEKDLLEKQLSEAKEEDQVELEQLHQKVFDLTAYRDWLVGSGIPTAVEALRDSDDFLDHVAVMVAAAKDMGHHEGLLVGSAANVDVKTHSYFDPLAEERLAKTNDTFDDAKFTILEAVAVYVERRDFEGLRKFLACSTNTTGEGSGAA